MNRNLFFLQIICFCSFLLSIYHIFHQQNYQILLSSDNENPASYPVVLQWNEFHWTEIIHNNLKCPKKCIFTKSIKHDTKADVIIFYMGDGILKEIPSTNNSKRLNVFVNFEPPPCGPYVTNLSKDFFNYTVTYRLDSNLPMPYDCLKELEENDNDRWTDEEVDEIISNKNDTALFLTSQCNTDSKREKVIEKIKKYMNITQFGACNDIQCPRNQDCEKTAIKNHYFYFAFENSVCMDYITEKLFRFRQLIVPIILDRKVLRGENLKLNPYIIAVSDFKSIKDLVAYLKMLMANKNEYKKYFEWTKFYKKTNKSCIILDNLACKMCDLAWDVKNGYRNIIPDIQQWHERDQCHKNYGLNIVEAPISGTIRKIYASKKDKVEGGELIIEIERD